MPPAVETYEQAIEYLFGRINYERVHATDFAARDFKLDRMRLLLRELGNPQESIPCVHIAGSKGKGSTAAMVAQILTAAEYRTGLFTSPHIDAFEERMRVDGDAPSRAALVELVNDVAPVVAEMDRMTGRMNPTYFEIATAMAWRFFALCHCDIAVLEVGLGGRLDSTNVCHPVVTVITSISRDHMNVLGSSIREIAREKAGILKPDVPLVSGVTDAVARHEIQIHANRLQVPFVELGSNVSVTAFENASGETLLPTLDISTPWRKWSGVPQPMVGDHQVNNTAVAVAVADVLDQRGYPIGKNDVYRGLLSVRLPLRIEVIGRDPFVVVDAAHNWASVQALVTTLDSRFQANRRILVFATTKDKDVAGMLRLLVPNFDTVILTQYLNNPRAESASVLTATLMSFSDRHVHVAPDPTSAWKLAQHLVRRDDLICVTGSFFIAAEMREIVTDSSNGSTCAESQVASNL